MALPTPSPSSAASSPRPSSSAAPLVPAPSTSPQPPTTTKADPGRLPARFGGAAANAAAPPQRPSISELIAGQAGHRRRHHHTPVHADPDHEDDSRNAPALTAATSPQTPEPTATSPQTPEPTATSAQPGLEPAAAAPGEAQALPAPADIDRPPEQAADADLLAAFYANPTRRGVSGVGVHDHAQCPPGPSRGHGGGTFVDLVLYINLPMAARRRQDMDAQLCSMSLPYARYPAVQVATLAQADAAEALYAPGETPLLHMPAGHVISPNVDEPPVERLDRQAPLRPVTAFRVSVVLSHLTAYMSLLDLPVEGGNAVYVIVEDDVVLSDNFDEDLRGALAALPADWEVARLGHVGATREEDWVEPAHAFAARQPFYDQVAEYCCYYGGAFGVAVQRRTLPLLIEKLRRTNVTDVDGMLTAFPHIRSYVVDPPLLTHDDSPHLEERSHQYELLLQEQASVKPAHRRPHLHPPPLRYGDGTLRVQSTRFSH